MVMEGNFCPFQKHCLADNKDNCDFESLKICVPMPNGKQAVCNFCGKAKKTCFCFGEKIRLCPSCFKNFKSMLFVLFE